MILPPSRLSDGRAYRWLNEADLAACPPALLARMPLPPSERAKQQREERQDTAGPDHQRSPQARRAYGRKALRGLCDELAGTPEGRRNKRLFDAAFRCGCLVNDGYLDADEVSQALGDAAVTAGLGVEEINATLESAWTASRGKSANVPPPPPDDGGSEGGSANAAPKTDFSDYVDISFAEIRPSEDHWLWKPFFPYGELTDLIGEKTRGKTAVLVDIAARKSAGRPMPNFDDEPPEPAEPPGRVLWLCHEERAGALRRRFALAGADLKLIRTVAHRLDHEDVISGKVTELLAHIDRTVLAVHDDWALGVFEPITSFLVGVKSSDDSAVREQVLRPLRDMARRHRMAVAFSIHMNKKEELSHLNRALNSVAFVNYPRSILFLNKDPEDKNIIRMVGAGNMNVPGYAPGFMVRRVRVRRNGRPAGEVPKLTWEATTSSIDAEALMAGKPATAEKRDHAILWLSTLLARGPVAQHEVKVSAAAEGINWATVRRAKERLDVVSYKQGNTWFWSFPQQADEGAHSLF